MSEGKEGTSKPPAGFNWRPLSNVKFAMELAGSGAGRDGNGDAGGRVVAADTGS